MGGLAPAKCQQHESSALPSDETTPGWLTQPGLPEIERRRRVLVLHRVCTELLNLPACQRPRSLAAFANFTRKSRKIRCFTVAPLSLCLRLDGVPEEVIAHVKSQERPPIVATEFLEEPSEEAIRAAKQRWKKRDQEGWTRNFVAYAKWIETAAYVARVYSAQEVISAFIELGVFSSNSYGQDLLDVQVSKSLPMAEFVPEVPWSQLGLPARRHICHKVTLPPICSGPFIGIGGTNCRALTLQLQEHANESDVDSVPRVQLNLRLPNGRGNYGIVELHIHWRQWECLPGAHLATMKMASMGRELHQRVIQRINEMLARRMAVLSNRRSKRAERLQEAGRAYHDKERLARSSRLNAKDDSACRGLVLPPLGISRKRGNPSLNRKDVGKQRRRALLQEKRKHALQACCALGFLQSPCFQESTDAQTCEDMKDFCYKTHNGSINGAARRMLKHLSSCDDQSAMMAVAKLESAKKAADRPIKQPKRQRQKQSRQQSRLMAIGVQTETTADAELAEAEWAAEAESGTEEIHA